MLTGRRPNSITSFNDKTIKHLTRRLQTHDYPILIKRLNELSVVINFRNNSREFYELMKILNDIENRLLHYERDPTQTESAQYREDFEVETINVESARVFRQYGGIEIFKRILVMSLLVAGREPQSHIFDDKKTLMVEEPLSVLRRKNKCSQQMQAKTQIPTNVVVENFSILKIKCKCIHILNRIVCLPKFGKLVVNDLLYVTESNVDLYKKEAQDSNSNRSTGYNAILLQYLFSLVMFKEARLLSCQLIESILLHMPMLNLNCISNIKYILETIDDEGLSSICRIFAITLSDLDMAEKKCWSQNKQQQLHQNSQQAGESQQQQPMQIDDIEDKPKPAPLSVRDQNQDLLLNIPSLLSRLVNLVRRKDYTIRYTDSNSEIEHWMRYLDEALSDNEDSDANTSNNSNNPSNMELMMLDISSSANNSMYVDGNNNNISGQFTNYRSGAPENQLYQPALLAATKLNNFVHVLYTLSLLLIGKERKQVQKTLSKLRLAAALNSLFDYLVWNCHCDQHGSSTMGEPQQVRSPEVAVKIQFLRLVHSFCDHSDYKRVILSREEIDEITTYNREASPCLQVDESMLKVENRLGCTKEKTGLLSKIVQVIKQEPFSDSFRFWLTRAVESFLRGDTSYADQLFLINRGIVEDTLHNILAINFTRPKEVLQSCFDMLGELIKFNNYGFSILDKELVDQERFNMLMRMIDQSLVDSNMFLRAIFLSIEFFERNAHEIKTKYASNQTLAYFSSFDRQISLLCKMITTINLTNLSQENISCLNTTLVLLMLANRKKKLPQYLKAIQQKSQQIRQINDIITNSPINIVPQQTASSEFNAAFIDTMTNFKELLIFWQGHYLQKDKDCVGLEQNSRIEFSYWKYTVELLLDSNPKNKCSLNYYIKNDPNYYENKPNRMDEYRCD